MFHKEGSGQKLVLDKLYEWDLELVKPDKVDYTIMFSNRPITDSYLALWYDTTEPNSYITGSTEINSLTGFTSAVTSGFTINDIGLTGVDNGRFDSLTGESITFTQGNIRLPLYRISGTSRVYGYLDEIDNSGNYISLSGGYFQNFYRLWDYPYELLPAQTPNGWTAEFWLKISADTIDGTTDDFTNDGIFYYRGTRAENKFSNFFSGETGITTTEGIELTASTLQPYNFDPFLSGDTWYGRFVNSASTLTGITSAITSTILTGYTFVPIPQAEIDCITGSTTGSPSGYTVSEVVDFITACTSGITADTIVNSFTADTTGFTSVTTTDVITLLESYDIPELTSTTVTAYTATISDIDFSEYNRISGTSNNALAFMITKDGRIGYRKVSHEIDCVSNNPLLSIEQSFTPYQVFDNNDGWMHVVVRFRHYETGRFIIGADCVEDNLKDQKGDLQIFVNGRPVYKKPNFIDIIPRRHRDVHRTLQQGVPYNISWGGGTQGLSETITFDGPDNDDYGLLLERWFNGYFEGGISVFRLYLRPLSVDEIIHNFKVERDRFGRTENFGGRIIRLSSLFIVV